MTGLKDAEDDKRFGQGEVTGECKNCEMSPLNKLKNNGFQDKFSGQECVFSVTNPVFTCL